MTFCGKLLRTIVDYFPEKTFSRVALFIVVLMSGIGSISASLVPGLRPSLPEVEERGLLSRIAVLVIDPMSESFVKVISMPEKRVHSAVTKGLTFSMDNRRDWYLLLAMLFPYYNAVSLDKLAMKMFLYCIGSYTSSSVCLITYLDRF